MNSEARPTPARAKQPSACDWSLSLCPSRTLITGMASGSIVAFNIDFNRWHYEHQNRY